MHFSVFNGDGSLAGNALKSGNREAAKRQTQQEHNDLLDITTLPEYQQFMALPPAAKAIAMQQLKQKAEDRERLDPKYWDDANPRRAISQSSSWIGDFDYDPYANYLLVRMGNKDYGFASMTPDTVAEWINSPSLGQYFNDYIKGNYSAQLTNYLL